MKKNLMKYLCCPNCKSEFNLKIKREEEEIIEGELVCQKCNCKYPIIDTIPIILNKKKLKDFFKTKSNWENWWNKIRKKSDVELYDQLWTKAEKNLKGEPLLRKKDFTNKIVMDAGCGNGRLIQSDFSKFECKEIIAIDLGKQVFSAKQKNKKMKNVHYIQSDLVNLPIKDSVVDVIVSHGVLHHTPNPKKTFSKLSKHLKINGMFAIYVYHKEWAYYKTHKKSLLLDAMYSFGVLIWQTIRKITSRLPHPLLALFCFAMAIKSSVEHYLQSNKATRFIGKLMQLIPPFAYIGVNFHERMVRNYDHYSATYNYFFTIDEVIDWFSSNTFNKIEIASIPVSIRGIKQKENQTPLEIKQYPIIQHFQFRKEWDKLYQKIKQ